MLKIGKYNTLEVVKEVDFGLYLDGGPYGEILIPKSYTNETMEVGTAVEVFIYSDSEDRLIATTEVPKVICDQFAVLEVKEVTGFGAFLDWGITAKDLLVPFREQGMDMEVGKSYLVYAYLDVMSERIVATTKFNKFLKSENKDFVEGQEVSVFIAKKTPNGYKVIINETHWGMLYGNEVFKKLEVGDKEQAYIKHIREDKLIDISLQKQGYFQQIPDTSRMILNQLEKEKFIPLTDKSSPEKIYDTFQISKKNFKKAIGALYKRQLIELKRDGIYLKK